VISAENLIKQKTVNDVNFSFENGIMCVMSQSDKDKNALLSIICGLLKADKGEIKRDAEKIGYVAQGAPIPKTLKVSEYIQFAMRAKNILYFSDELKEKADELLPHTVSGLTNAQRYKAAIISELVDEPDLLLLERPSFDITFEEADELFEFIEEIAEETPVVFTSERVSELRKYSDNALILLNGKQLFFGSAEQFSAEMEKEGTLTVKVKGNIEKVKAVFEKYGAEILESVRKGTFKCVMNVSSDTKAEIRREIASGGLALLEMKADGDDLKKLIEILENKENELRMASDDEKAENEIKTLDSLRAETLQFSHDTDNRFEDTEDGDENAENEAPAKTTSALTEDEKEKKRRALFLHSNDDEDDDEGGSTLFSSGD